MRRSMTSRFCTVAADGVNETTGQSTSHGVLGVRHDARCEPPAAWHVGHDQVQRAGSPSEKHAIVVPHRVHGLPVRPYTRYAARGGPAIERRSGPRLAIIKRCAAA